jgi:hypothetical protein
VRREGGSVNSGGGGGGSHGDAATCFVITCMPMVC